MDSCWDPDKVLAFVDACYDKPSGGYRSTPHGEVTLYATSYAVLLRWYLGKGDQLAPRTADFILGCQEEENGYFVGPELRSWTPGPDARHNRQHVLLHLACAVLPALQQYDLTPRYPLPFAHLFCDRSRLKGWLEARDMADTWLEGNNMLFAGQLLVFLRDVESYPGAEEALAFYFGWLDERVDPATGLWGTDRGCSPFVAMCGAYHQLLVYYHEERPILYPERVIDTVLAIQHPDGGFSPAGGGGACEDADGVDILVNLYKLTKYRRPAIRVALRRTLSLLVSLQNTDGGFPYKRNASFVHMGIPATASPAGASNMFTTWFRVHTLALLAEILTDEPELASVNFRFNKALSMGWHRPWNEKENVIGLMGRLAEEAEKSVNWMTSTAHLWYQRLRRVGSRVKRMVQN